MKVYLDNNATTPLHPEVKKTMIEAMEMYGNPSSMHEYGRDARNMIEESRQTLASFVGAKEDEIIFVGSGSEANNTVFNLFPCPSKCCMKKDNKKNEVITTRIEHPCVLEASKCLETRGTKVHYLDVDKKGRINIEQLKGFLNEKTALVSIMMANNEIGTIQEIKEMVPLAHNYGAFFHTDAVQAVGKIPVDVVDLGVDFLSFSAHKIYGPKGVGALYVRKGVHYCPFIRGGHQEKGRRAGTENILGIVGMGKAIEMRSVEMKEEDKRLNKLRIDLREKILKNIPDVLVNGDQENILPGTLNVSFDGIEGEALLLYLDLEGIAASTGSACSSGSLDPSHVLLATGVGAESAHGSIRFSVGRENSKEDIDYVVEKLSAIVERLRAMSTAYNVENRE